MVLGFKHTGPVRCCCTLLNGNIVTGGEDNCIIIWNSYDLNQYTLLTGIIYIYQYVLLYIYNTYYIHIYYIYICIYIIECDLGM